MKYAYKGEKLKDSPLRRADEWNQVVDVVNAAQRGGGTTFAGSEPQSKTFVIYNESGLNLNFGAVLGVSGVPNDPAVDADLFKYDKTALVKADVPTSADSGKFLVTTGPIPEDGFGRAVISGPARVQIDVVSESHGFADVIDGDHTKLRSGGTGVPILYKQSGTGTKWGIVNVGSGGSALRATIVSWTDVEAVGNPVFAPNVWTDVTFNQDTGGVDYDTLEASHGGNSDPLLTLSASGLYHFSARLSWLASYPSTGFAAMRIVNGSGGTAFATTPKDQRTFPAMAGTVESQFSEVVFVDLAGSPGPLDIKLQAFHTNAGSIRFFQAWWSTVKLA